MIAPGMKGLWGKLAAGMLLLWGAVALRAQDFHDPAQFEPEIAQFEAADRRTAPPADPVLFIGSSSIRLWTALAADFPNLPVLNRGFGGAHVSDLVYYFPRVVAPYRPRIILHYAGDNDLLSGKTPARIFGDWTNFVAQVKRQLPGTPIAFISVKPSPARIGLITAQRELNETVRRHCAQDPQLKFIDVFSPMLDQQGQPRPELFTWDRTHLSEAGYALWRDLIRAELEQRFPGTRALLPRRWLLVLAAVALSVAAFRWRKRGELVPAG